MNVIGIVQTDLNEFNILFDPSSQDENQQHDDQQKDEGLFALFGGDDGSGNGNQPQEMTVRIKGIPEGQKAPFLQMYQIIQDAKELKELEENLTIVQRGEDQNQQGDQSGQNH